MKIRVLKVFLTCLYITERLRIACLLKGEYGWVPLESGVTYPSCALKMKLPGRKDQVILLHFWENGKAVSSEDADKVPTLLKFYLDKDHSPTETMIGIIPGSSSALCVRGPLPIPYWFNNAGDLNIGWLSIRGIYGGFRQDGKGYPEYVAIYRRNSKEYIGRFRVNTTTVSSVVIPDYHENNSSTPDGPCAILGWKIFD